MAKAIFSNANYLTKCMQEIKIESLGAKTDNLNVF